MPQSTLLEKSPPLEVPRSMPWKYLHVLVTQRVDRGSLLVHVCSLTATLVDDLPFPFTDSPKHGCASSGTPEALNMRLKDIS